MVIIPSVYLRIRFTEIGKTFRIVNLEGYERKLDEASVRTKLPDNPDIEKVGKFVERINRYVITGELI